MCISLIMRRAGNIEESTVTQTSGGGGTTEETGNVSFKNNNYKNFNGQPLKIIYCNLQIFTYIHTTHGPL